MTRYREEDEAARPSDGRRDSDVDLSIGQVLAATGATTIGAIVVKFLDLWGTVLGTAALSVCTSIGAVLILRTMRRTGERIKTQIAALSPAARADQQRTVDLGTPGPGGDPGRITATATVPAAAPGGAAARPRLVEAVGADADGATEYVAKPASRRRTLVAIAVSSVLVFGLTMGLLILLGGVTGDPGRFVHQPAPETTTIIQTPETDDSGVVTGPDEDATGPTPSDAPAETRTEEPAEDPTRESPSETPSSETPAEEPTSDPGDGSEAPEESPTPEEQDEMTTEAPDAEDE